MMRFEGFLVVHCAARYVWASYLAPVFGHVVDAGAGPGTSTSPVPVLTHDQRRVRAFKRWALDQLFFCYRYGPVFPKARRCKLFSDSASVHIPCCRRERIVVVGDWTEKVWEGKLDVCETSVTYKPLSSTHTRYVVD